MASSSVLLRPRMRFWLISSAVAALILTLASASVAKAAEPAGNPKTATIRIDNFTFGPETVIVTPGTAVTWINGDDIPHTVVSQSKLFRSKTLDTEDHYTFTFEAPGAYPYFCSLHPHMAGKVVVTAAAD